MIYSENEIKCVVDNIVGLRLHYLPQQDKPKVQLVDKSIRPEAKNSYIEVLEDNHKGIWEPGLTFIQDNAPINTAKKVEKRLEDNGVVTTDWPPYSLDLNPIEHLWFRRKELVYKVRRDIEEMGSNDEKIREVLFEALEKAWTMIDEGYMTDFIGSVENRVQGFIHAEGWYTRLQSNIFD